ncbi:MAG: RDD family protein [Oligoflexia bacterium]|nr:RDD family protein [Oligoflexia bacterium]
MSDNDDWDFKVAEEDVDQVKIAGKVASKKKSKPLKKKSIKKKKLEIDDSAKPKRRSRAAIARRDAALERYAEFRYPDFMKRGCAILIDAIILIVVAVAAMSYQTEIKDVYLQYLRDNGMNQSLTPDEVKYLFIGAPVIIGHFLLNIFPSVFWRKSIGKSIFKIRIGHDDVDKNSSQGQVFIRELIAKPLSLLIVVGIVIPFFNERNKSLHDYMMGTCLYIDD